MATIVVSEIIQSIETLCAEYTEVTDKLTPLKTQVNSLIEQQRALAVRIDRERRRLDDALGLVHAGLAFGPED